MSYYTNWKPKENQALNNWELKKLQRRVYDLEQRIKTLEHENKLLNELLRKKKTK